MNASSPAQVWVPDIEGVAGSIYLAVADAIGAAVARGELKPGQQLPTHRAMAEALGADLTTITRAYAEARRRGLLQATVGRGSFVRAAPAAVPAPVEDGPVDLGMNLPPVPSQPNLPALMRDGLARLLEAGRPRELLTYRPGAGTAEERAAGASWLRPTLGEVDPARLLVCPGAQAALSALLGVLGAADRVVLCEQLTYPGLRAAAAAQGAQLSGIPADEDGLLPDALDEACRRLRPVALYCTPTQQNPTATTMPPARRQAIAEVLLRHGVKLIEDDAYGLLPSQRLPALAALAPGLGWHVATLSKTVSPALRVAFVAAPDAQGAARLAGALRAAVLMASPLLTGLAAAWVHDGTAAAVLAAIRAETTARQALARDVLPSDSVQAHPEGLHLWLRLPAAWNRLDFAAHLHRHDGLAVVPSDAFAVPPLAPPDAVRLSLGAAAGLPQLDRALRRVAAALAHRPEAAFRDVV